MSRTVEFAKELAEVSLESRMRESYLDYAMSVIVGRALPDVRDGLKPVHRRILFAMCEAGNDWNKAHKKSARIVGDVLGKFHPHSQDAVYDALVRMAQTFSMGECLVDGQGNFGSIDGDNPAAMRYTEVRMAKIAHSLLEDIDKQTVDFLPNYDGAEMEPTVLPARFPNLLVNGASGIAVGMATNIPPHNLGEAVDACLLLLKNPDADISELVKIIPAPDFPTGGFIHGVKGAREAFSGGRGRVVMRGRTHFEPMDKGGRQMIVVDELPYQVNKAVLITRIADLVRDKKLEGITDLRDESDRTGIRIVIELRRGENPEVILNNLYKETQLQDNFAVNMVALSDGAPKLLSLPEILTLFLRHSREVVVRRALFELNKARARAHLLEGFAAATTNMDEVVNLIKAAHSPAEAEKQLLARPWTATVVAEMLNRLEDPALARPENADPTLGLQKGASYLFSSAQAKAILDMRLARLTAMERGKILADYEQVVKEIVDCLVLLNSPTKINTVVADNLRAVKKMFARPRRSEIVEDPGDIDLESLISEEDMAVTFSHRGYVKRQPISEYRTQRRGGRGKQAASTREDDFMSQLFVASTHDYLLMFTTLGRVYWKKVYELPLASRVSRGRPVVQLLPLQENENVQTVLALRSFDDERSVVICTAAGTVKKIKLNEFSRPRRGGIIALGLRDNDRLINAVLATERHTVLLFSAAGKVIRFQVKDLRAMGRGARGVRGMRLAGGQSVVSMLAVDEEEGKQVAILVATDGGRGKRTHAHSFPIKGRGGLGVIALKIDGKKAKVIGATVADEDDDLMLITNAGVLVRTSMAEIRRQGRATAGVRLINLDEDSYLVSIARIADADNDS